MPESCAAFGCTNRRKRGSGVSFHKFPLGNPTLLRKWTARVSRANFHPNKHHVLCSEHFVKENYIRGIHPRDDSDVIRHELYEGAFPSVFPAHPPHKQRPFKHRPPPKRRVPLTDESASASRPPPKIAAVCKDHDYSSPADRLVEQLKRTTHELREARKELKVAKQKVKRRDAKIASLLEEVKNQNMISQGQLDLLKQNFGENTFTLIENELINKDVDKRGYRYSDSLTQFAVTLHFYSVQAYEFMRQYLHLPNI